MPDHDPALDAPSHEIANLLSLIELHHPGLSQERPSPSLVPYPAGSTPFTFPNLPMSLPWEFSH
jgi:hypothetical protein